MKQLVRRMGSFSLLLACTDCVYIFIVWLIYPSGIKSVGAFILLFSLLILIVAIYLEQRRYRKIVKGIEKFLEAPDQEHKEELLHTAGNEWKESIELLHEKLAFQSARINESQTELTSYREFIEAWVHEMKTPLSLSTLVLNNRRDEMSDTVYSRMSYAQRQIEEEVERILYYARLQAEHPDFKFTDFRLDACVLEVVDEYRLFANENHIVMNLELQPLTVSSDQKVVHFILSQLLSNACKYAEKENGKISVLMWQENNEIHLAVRDNGAGIPPEDAPFIFDKGFTGSQPQRQKATGMGLYLVSKYAEALRVDVMVEAGESAGGFGIELIFKL